MFGMQDAAHLLRALARTDATFLSKGTSGDASNKKSEYRFIF